MLDRRMIGDRVYKRYEFKQLSPTARDLYTYILLDCDNDGVCDSVYDVMTLVKASRSDMLLLLNSQFVYEIANKGKENPVVWLPDFLILNTFQNGTRGYAPSIYRDILRREFPWAPVVIIHDKDNKLRTDIINDNFSIGCDPRTGLPYKACAKQTHSIDEYVAAGYPYLNSEMLDCQTTPSVHSGAHRQKEKEKKRKRNNIYDDDDWRNIIHTRILYNQQHTHLDIIGKELLDDIVADIIDVYTTTSDPIYINTRESYNAAHVRAQYDKIDADIVQYIINRLRNANIGTDARAYIRTVTYNATKTIDTQYNSDARHGQ